MNAVQNLDLLKLSPYIRYANRISGTAADYYVPWRIIYDFEVIFMVEGELEVVCKDKKYLLEAGDFHLMRPFVEHRRRIPEGKSCTYYNLHLDFYYDADNENFQAEEVYCVPCELKVEKAEVLDRLADRTVYGMSDTDRLEKYRIEDPVPYLERFETIRREYNRQGRMSLLRMRGVFLEILSDLLEEMEKNGEELQEEDVIVSFMRYSMEHYNEDINIAALAREYGFSPNYFRKVFKTATQLTPREYLLHYRIEQAKRLLHFNRYAVSEIAYMVGYNDINYFCKVFKKEVGCSPTQYAQAEADKKETPELPEN